MPQTGLSFDGGQRGAHGNPWKVNHLLNEHIPGRSSVKGAALHHSRSDGSQTSGRSSVGSLGRPRPPHTVNGHVNHGHEGESPKAALPKKVWARESDFSPVTASAASAPGAGNPCCKYEHLVPDPSLSAPKNNHRGRKKFRQKKKRDDKDPSSGSSAPPLMPQQEQEDWEKEIQEVTLRNWEKMCFGVAAYGPEDVIHFTLRGSTLQERTTADLPATASYSPAVHHVRPLRWRCYRTPAEPDQFANAEE
ncbi:uncharacterized protein LOC108241530 [Kryptolebias marmoratus]|uniref:uncharacterized protein LOC108241530 n=1 Tax=Kryptolebias marmoratus TaxID=37003 RepID=UPI0007F89ACC|nr:uncharacterized protein LOC108241530 [Kryptolebias marmoratus]